jgi:hypothetical protein
MRETEDMLTELQRQHQSLTQLYETLQLEHSAVKQELENLRSQHESSSPSKRSFLSWLREWDESGGESADPLMFDASVFSYDAYGDQNNEACF